MADPRIDQARQQRNEEKRKRLAVEGRFDSLIKGLEEQRDRSLEIAGDHRWDGQIQSSYQGFAGCLEALITEARK